MTEEEKEATENLNKLVQQRKDKTNTITIKYDNCICSTKELYIALNLIQRQQEENIKLKQENENLKNREKHQSKEIKKAVDYTFELNVEIEKKDKTIDAMAKQLYIEGYCKEINCKKM